MKLTYVIVLSLGLNAILAASVFRPKPAAPVSTDAAATSVPAPASGTKASPTLAAPVIVDVPGEAFSWRKIEAADYHRYVANLRAIHCPEETIQDIIYNDVTKLYAEKQRALNREYKYGPSGATDYWKTDMYTYNAERARKSRQLAAEKTALLLDLLGVDVEKLQRERQGIPDYEALQYPFLTEDKRKQVKDLAQRFQDLEQGLYQKYKDYFGEERNAEFMALNKQKEEELAKILTPYELEEYKVRQSNTAQQMRWSLQAFEPSEQEFRSLFKVEDAWTAVRGQNLMGPDPDDPVEQKKWRDAQQLKDDQVKQVLGDDRYKEYTRSRSYDYQQLYRLAQSTGLPKETAGKVYDMKEAAESQISKVQGDQSLTPDQKQQALAAIREATVQAVQTSLGEKNYKKYESNGGYWLRNFSRSTSQRVITR